MMVDLVKKSFEEAPNLTIVELKFVVAVGRKIPVASQSYNSWIEMKAALRQAFEIGTPNLTIVELKWIGVLGRDQDIALPILQ